MVPALQTIRVFDGKRNTEPRGTVGVMAPREFRSRRRLTVAIAIAVLVLSVGFGVANSVTAGGDPLHVDTAWMAAVHLEASPWIAPSLFLHYLGAGLPAFVTVSVTAGALLLWHRPWGAGCLLV